MLTLNLILLQMHILLVMFSICHFNTCVFEKLSTSNRYFNKFLDNISFCHSCKKGSGHPWNNIPKTTTKCILSYLIIGCQWNNNKWGLEWFRKHCSSGKLINFQLHPSKVCAKVFPHVISVHLICSPFLTFESIQTLVRAHFWKEIWSKLTTTKSQKIMWSWSGEISPVCPAWERGNV